LLTLENAIQLVMALPGTKAEQARQLFANILTRHFAGDKTLADETARNAESDGPIPSMARESLKRTREGAAVDMSGGAGVDQAVVEPGIDSKSFLAAIQCFKDMQEQNQQMHKEALLMQEEKHKEVLSMQEKLTQAAVKTALAEREVELLQAHAKVEASLARREALAAKREIKKLQSQNEALVNKKKGQK